MEKENISIFELMSKPEKINFAFQPIFEIETGNIYGYEALMRPAPYTPMEVIAEYAHQDRLNEIEEFTTYYAAKQFLENKLPGKLFINSFPSAFVSDDMMVKVHELVKQQLKGRLIIEMLEYTEFDSHAHYKKTSQFRESKTGQLVAIDVTNQKALIDICNYLEKKGIIILAEGVETQEEYDYLKKYPIKLMQGYFLGKPQIFKDYSN